MEDNKNICSKALEMDFFKFTPQLNVNNKKGFKTSIGFFFSILVYALIILSFISFGKEMFLRESPIIVS